MRSSAILNGIGSMSSLCGERREGTSRYGGLSGSHAYIEGEPSLYMYLPSWPHLLYGRQAGSKWSQVAELSTLLVAS